MSINTFNNFNVTQKLKHTEYLQQCMVYNNNIKILYILDLNMNMAIACARR